MRKTKNLLIIIASIVCLLFSMNLLSVSAATTIKAPSIKKIQANHEQKRILMEVTLPSAGSGQYEIYRSKEKTKGYKLLDILPATGNIWDVDYSTGYRYVKGTKGKITWYHSSEADILVDGSAGINQYYYYKIRVKSSEGKCSKWSNIKTAKLTLPAPAIVQCYVNAAYQAKISWIKVKDAKGYILYQKEGSSWKKVATLNSSAASYTQTGLQNGKTYQYKICGYVKSGGKTVKGAYSNICKVTVKAPAVNGSYYYGSVYGPSLPTSKLQEVRYVVQGFKDNYITSGMSDLDKAWAVFWYIRDNCVYAVRGWQYNYANTAWGSLVYGEAQCSGYARGVKALCDGIGLDCRYVHANGKAMNPSHQWNMVKVDGKWYILDAQSGAFLVGANLWKNYMRMDWDTNGLPACSAEPHKNAGFYASMV